MKVYVPFFIVSVCLVLFLSIFYNPALDFIVRRNIYSYSNESFEIILDKNLKVDKYYNYIDCNVGKKEFVDEYIWFYKEIDECSVEIEKVNYLLKWFDKNEVHGMINMNFDYTLINDENVKFVKQIIFDSDFDENKFERYLSYSGSKVILNVNLNHDLIQYKDYNEVNDINSLTIINNYNKVGGINYNFSYCIGYYVYNEEMCNGLQEFLEELRNHNVNYLVTKTVTYDDLFDEHISGLAIDIDYDNQYDGLVESIASRHGFILRYKQEYNDVVGHVEPGHFRYVGEKSLDIYSKQISLEEFVYFNS